MSRQLNHELFGPSREASRPSSPSYTHNAENFSSPLPSTPKESPSPSPESLQGLIYSLETLKRKMKDMDFKVEAVNSRVTEIASALKGRIERLAGLSHRVEEMAKMGFQEIHQKQAQMGSRVTERRMHDTKVEELVDRHNQVLNQFEVRLNHMQRVISEQEMQLLNSRSALQEALKEIARLTGR